MAMTSEKFAKRTQQPVPEQPQPSQVPSEAPRSSGPVTPGSETEEYLLSRGWKKSVDAVPGYWDEPPRPPDPPRRIKIMEMTRDDGTKEDVYQMHGSTIPWIYRMEEAMEIQKQRDQQKQRVE